MKGFREILPVEITDNFIESIGQGWMLVTAGDAEKCNTMTASWGFAGQMWGKSAAMVVIRPTRFTKQFVDSSERLTLSFFDATYRKALQYCGSHSGRDGNKIAEAGLTVALTDDGTPALAEARLVLECRKMYVDGFREESFLRPELVKQWYPQKDFHAFYIVEIVKVYVK